LSLFAHHMKMRSREALPDKGHITAFQLPLVLQIF